MAAARIPVLIVGGGTAGITVAARLSREPDAPPVTLLEPSARHFYQPLWTLVGGGVVAKETTVRPEADCVPDGVTWLPEGARELLPDEDAVITTSGRRLVYEQLVVAAGIQLDWDKIAGLDGHLGKDGLVSIYGYDLADRTWEALRAFDGGDAIFTFPSTPVKCAGAPQKIMYLADDTVRRRGVRERSRVIWCSAGDRIFGVAKYRAALERVLERRAIETHWKRDLAEVRPRSREAIFRSLDGAEELVLRYDLLHIAPPQSAPDLVKRSPLAGPGGWVEVDKHTLRHVRYPKVFSLGDCSSLPTSRTGAAVRAQAPVLVANLLAARAGAVLPARYDGYTSCPLITGYGKLILAEFDYDGRPVESFPFDQGKERYSMWALKAYALPELYWNGMLRGRL